MVGYGFKQFYLKSPAMIMKQGEVKTIITQNASEKLRREQSPRFI